MSSPETSSRRRLFLALWPDEIIRRRLVRERDRAATGHRGRPVADDNLHVTLVFLGGCDEGQQACVERTAAQVRGASFTLTLERMGYWPRPRVMWLGAEQTPAALTALVEDLTRGLAECGFPREERPFRPHITLMRKVLSRPRFEPSVDEPVQWPVNDFHLVESLTRSAGAEYRIVATWPLATVAD